MADLHIGRSLGEIDLIEDQRAALRSAVECVKTHKPDAVLIAGDVYDRAMPSERAVALADEFFTALTACCETVCVIGGNHDSQERLSFARQLLEKQGLHIAGDYRGRLTKVDCRDATIWLMPFFRPREAAGVLGPFEPMTFDGAVRAALAREEIDPTRVNVLVAHQFVTAARGRRTRATPKWSSPRWARRKVDYRAFDAFDYVALGHLHKPQRAGREGVCYAGSLLKYSASEAGHKSRWLWARRQREIFPFPWSPIAAPHDLRVIRGELEKLTAPEVAKAGDPNDYLHVTLTDATLPPDAQARLRLCYPNIFRMEYAPPAEEGLRALPMRRGLSAREMFREFYRLRNGRDMDEGMASCMDGVFDEAGREAAQ